MDKQQAATFTRVAVIILVLLVLFAMFLSPAPNAGVVSSAAALTLITAGAVAIERVIEAFWTFIGLTKNSWWPLKSVGDYVSAVTKVLDTQIQPFYEAATQAIDKVSNASAWTEAQLAAANNEVQDLQKLVNELNDLAPGNQRIQLVTGLAKQQFAAFGAMYPELQQAANIASEAAQGLSKFAASFKDNPGRRLISIFVGAWIGTFVAGLFGLDMFQAVLGNTMNNIVPGILVVVNFHPGAALTGIIMGLGSNPTHEAIRLLEELKKMRKQENLEGR